MAERTFNAVGKTLSRLGWIGLGVLIGALGTTTCLLVGVKTAGKDLSKESKRERPTYMNHYYDRKEEES